MHVLKFMELMDKRCPPPFPLLLPPPPRALHYTSLHKTLHKSYFAHVGAGHALFVVGGKYICARLLTDTIEGQTLSPSCPPPLALGALHHTFLQYTHL